MNKRYLAHHGILGMKWGVRRFQNEDGSLTPRGIRRYQRLDEKWIAKRSDKIYKDSLRGSTEEMSAYVKELSEKKGVGDRTLINMYNKKLADVMRTKTSNIRSPSGKVIEWVAKRGQIGVHMALADQGYDISKLKNGVWADGRVAYKTKVVDMQYSKGGG